MIIPSTSNAPRNWRNGRVRWTVTFHRAFDRTPDPLVALEDAIAAGATRILTAGGVGTALQGVETLRKLVQAAGKRIVIMPGGGLDAGNILEIAAKSQASEFHSGLGSVLPYGSSNLQRFEAEIHSMKGLLTRTPLGSNPVTAKKT
ncbi:MAG: copper homeostasis protein CutC [Candidatus Acidiferrum sp.]